MISSILLHTVPSWGLLLHVKRSGHKLNAAFMELNIAYPSHPVTIIFSTEVPNGRCISDQKLIIKMQISQFLVNLMAEV